MDENAEILAEFLAESRDGLEQVDRDLVALEHETADPDRIAGIFRAVHTIKGTAGFFGFAGLEAVAHAGEHLLGRMRDGEIAPTAFTVSALLELSDALRRHLDAIDAGAVVAGNDDALLATLAAAADPAATAAQPDAPPATEPELTPEPEVAAPAAAAAKKRASRPRKAKAAPAPAPDAEIEAEAEAGEITDAPSAPRAVEAEQVPATAGTAAAAPAPSSGAAASHGGGSVRVDVGLLDEIMNLVGELVLARNQLVVHAGNSREPGVVATSQRIDLVTSALQDRVTRTRMQAIGTIWGTYPRVVRDLAVACDKKVQLELAGEETELDKTVCEALRDPLTHLLRNAVDHGLEKPADRLAAGKPEAGTVTFRAFHEGGHVIVEIADDGKGIDLDRVAARAIERGVVTPELLERMRDDELVDLIFRPGFSTAEQVTNVSGRGVGMDVVRTNIQRIGGSVEVSSERGTGTTFRVRVPLTLAIVPAILVGAGDQRYAIPQESVAELLRLGPDQQRTELDTVLGCPVLRLRDELLPLVHLDQALELAPAERQPGAALRIVVLNAGEHRYGLVVDTIADSREIVVKPVGRLVEKAGLFSGATILGDGSVSLILDIASLGRREGVDAVAGRIQSETRSTATAVESRPASWSTLALLELPGGGRAAVPLDAVVRLERFDRSAVEDAGHQPVVRYRDQLLPLVGVPGDWSNRLSVVVCRVERGEVGIVVDRVVDVVGGEVRLGTAAFGGELRTAVLDGGVTELMDLDALTASTLLFDQEARVTAGV